MERKPTLGEQRSRTSTGEKRASLQDGKSPSSSKITSSEIRLKVKSTLSF